ncbi:MAG: amidase family protein, partial [Bacteroidota bacterium]
MRHLSFCCFIFAITLTSCSAPQSKYEQLGLEEITITKLLEGYDSGAFSAVDVVTAYLDRIEAIDKNGPAINSIIAVNPNALDIALELDQLLADGAKKGPLHGVPVILKDNIDTYGDMPNTAGARVMAGSMPDQDAFIAAKLKEAGAIIIAKANLSEWANFHSSYSSSGWSGLGGQTKNPFDITR